MCQCDQALELISRQLDEKLSTEEENVLAEHLESCEECAALALDLQRLHQEMPVLSMPVPEGFADAVLEQIRRESAMSEQAVPGRKKTWWAWGGLVAAALVIVVGVSRLAPFAMGGTSGSSAAAPAPEPTAAESAYGAIARDQEMEYAASQAEADGATQEEQTFSLTAQQPKAMTRLEENAIISGRDTDSTAPEEEQFTDDTGLTAVDAGYMVLEAAVPEEISTLENATQDESLTLYATTKDGDMYTLLYHGISEDGSVYLFTLTTPDGTEQSWTAAVDSSGVVQNK